MAIFADRAHAGRELAGELAHLRGMDAVVLGIPRGGVVVAAPVARALMLPLGVAVVRKLGAPQHDEFALGAIADGVRVVDPVSLHDAKVTPAQLAAVEQRERAELARRTTSFELTGLDVSGRTVIIIDDGIATGSTARAACLAQRGRGAARIVLAVPVAPQSWRPDPAEVDEYICPHREAHFWAVGQYYDDFTQTTDDEVTRLLSDSPEDS